MYVGEGIANALTSQRVKSGKWSHPKCEARVDFARDGVTYYYRPTNRAVFVSTLELESARINVDALLKGKGLFDRADGHEGTN